MNDVLDAKWFWRYGSTICNRPFVAPSVTVVISAVIHLLQMQRKYGLSIEIDRTMPPVDARDELRSRHDHSYVRLLYVLYMDYMS